MAAFNKTKPIFVRLDNGTDNRDIYLNKDNDWSTDNLGLTYFENNIQCFYPWVSVVFIMQFPQGEENEKSS